MSVDQPGFADAVLGAQSCFRAVLDAMARPGTLHAATTGLATPPGLDPATAAVLLTLVDADTSLHATAAFDAARDWIAFHCGIVADAPQDVARFVLAARLPPLDRLCAGSDEAPEEAATVLLQIRTLGTGRRLLLSGPGLRVPAILAADGLPDDFVAEWRANRARFPLGVDLVLCAGTTLAALPRSVTVEEG